jgi:DNA-binding helix-hairpin-helix protein with protein kinase domain
MSRISSASQSEVISPIHKIFHTSQSDVVRLGRRIGTGAEGEVYDIQDRGDLVAKVYHRPPPPEKAEKLVVLSNLGNERLFNLSAWPISTLRDAPDGDVAGFVMRKISEAEEVHTLHSPKSRLQKFPEASWAFLIYVAANIARAVAAIHEHGLLIGDVNPKNILVTRKATVYLLDVDSFQVSSDGRTYRCEGGFPEYTPPELQGVAFRDVDRVQEHDCFGLAVVIFQLLFLGRHPYSGMYLGAGEMPLDRAIREFRFAYGVDAEARKMRQPPGTLALDSMPPALVDLFRRAFLTADRPHPREWVEQLDALSKALKKCDLHTGHYYYSELSECPWCGIEKQARVQLFNFLVSGDDSRRGPFRLDEIWREIVNVRFPDSSLIQSDENLKAPEPSAEVAAYAKRRYYHFIAALLISIIAGLAIPSIPNFAVALFLLVLSGIAACYIGKTGWISKVKSLFKLRQSAPDDPLFEKVQTGWRRTKEEAHLLKEWFDREAGNDRWRARRDELRNRKETYENLAQIRKHRLDQLEDEARNTQLIEFLDQFKINDANLKGIGSNLKTVLLSHGVVTAADLNEDVTQIPSVGRTRAKWLNEWRLGLEKKFAFDPAGGVQHEARVKVEREIDTLRRRLESELIGGAHYLRHIKQEIETSREKLQPVLTRVNKELAQAEKDLQVARKRNSAGLIITALIIAFLIGLAARPAETRVDIYRGDSVSRAPAGNGQVSTADQPNRPTATAYYREGKGFLEKENFEWAAKSFRFATEVDPNFYAAYEGLGAALLGLKKYDESAEASSKAISLHSTFKSYYNLGLALFARENWSGATAAFERGIELRDTSSWKDEYTQAYYCLGLSLQKTGELSRRISELEANRGFLEIPVNRFKLAVFYLCGGWIENMDRQHRSLKNTDPALAGELDKLISKYGKRA